VHLLAGRALQAPHRQLEALGKLLPHTAFDRLVAPAETVFADKVLMDAPGRQSRTDCRADLRQELPAQAHPPGG